MVLLEREGMGHPGVSLLKLASHLVRNLNPEGTGVQGTLICISLITTETGLLFTS